MQINRLFETVYILLMKERVAAKELAERFEISVRTVYRDIEILSDAGIPVYMSRGKNGGISLLPGFVLNKAVITEAEKTDILSALQSLCAVGEGSAGETFLKLSSLLGQKGENYVQIDFGDWGGLLKERFEIIKQAILNTRLLTFEYASARGEQTIRTVEPITLWFKEKTWYLKAYCTEKHACRLFKLSRMSNVVSTQEVFLPHAVPSDAAPPQNIPCETEIVVQIDKSQRYRVLDDFPQQSVSENDNGSFTVTMSFIEDDWVYGYLLSFGEHLKIISPHRIRSKLKQQLFQMLENYS